MNISQQFKLIESRRFLKEKINEYLVLKKDLFILESIEKGELSFKSKLFDLQNHRLHNISNFSKTYYYVWIVGSFERLICNVLLDVFNHFHNLSSRSLSSASSKFVKILWNYINHIALTKDERNLCSAESFDQYFANAVEKYMYKAIKQDIEKGEPLKKILGITGLSSSDTLATIKDLRNKIAHGQKSFYDTPPTVIELQQLSRKVFNDSATILKEVEKYIQSYSY